MPARSRNIQRALYNDPFCGSRTRGNPEPFENSGGRIKSGMTNRSEQKFRKALIPLLGATLFVMLMLAAVPEGCAQERAPGISLRDVNGRIFSLQDHEKKTLLIIFSTTWCATCRTEIPHFKDIYHIYGPRGLVVANIDIQESREKVARYAAKYQLPYRVLLDETGSVAAAYGIMGVPAMVLIKNGVIVTRQYRQVDGALERLFRK